MWMMWHWYARKKSSWTKHSLLWQKLRVFRAIPWLRKCASKKFGPCAGKYSQRGAMVNRHPRREQEDQVLPDEVKRSLDGQWEACHGFVLKTFRLLSETQQNKIYRMSHGAPRAFPIVLLESMRLLCRLTDGKPVKAASSTEDSKVSEEVSGVFELWTRLRAFFTTLAHTSIDQKDWFGFGECEQSNTFGMWILVCVHASVSSTVFQTRLDCRSVSGYKHLPPASLVKHVWILVPCCVQASVSTSVSNMFGLRFLVCVHASVHSPVFRMRLDCGSLSVHTHPSPALFKHV